MGMVKVEFNFKKKFGQNFLKDSRIVDAIVQKSDIDENTLVIEVGPGAGALTTELAKRAGKVICFEVDESLKEILDKNLSFFDNVEVIYGDFLEADVNEVLKKYEFSKKIMVANLPYYITTPIVTKIIDDSVDVSRLVIMVQKEVADRFSAKTGSRDYNSLTVFLNYYFDIKKIINVPRNCFYPVPNVDSAVVSMNRKDGLELKNRDLFFKLVRDSFKYKRKTLRNNLKGYDLDLIEKILKTYGYDLTVRAENLDINIFVDIANRMS